MKQFAVLLSLTLGFSLNTEAQSFLNDLRTDKAGQGTVTVSQSKDIDELVNNAKLIKSAPTTATNEKSNNATAAPAVNTAKKVMRNSRRITGYRVQAYSGGNSRADRQKAESIGSAIKMRFPDLPVYVHFYSPRWICRVGNFRTYDEANSVLKEIKSMGYRQACIVKGKITVGY